VVDMFGRQLSRGATRAKRTEWNSSTSATTSSCR
jgi:hypothetical protein